MDWSAIIIAFLSFCGTLMGSLSAMKKVENLIEYRLVQLEKKVDKHNNVIERTYRLEDRAELMEERLKVANHRIKDLEEFEKENIRS